jgi:hypothetical protein
MEGCKQQCDDNVKCRGYEFRIDSNVETTNCTLQFDQDLGGDGNLDSLCYVKEQSDAVIETDSFELLQTRQYCVNHVDISEEREFMAETIEQCFDAAT